MNFAMFTDAGNAAIAALYEKACKLPPDCDEDRIYKLLSKGLDGIALKHEEAWDTAVREALVGRIERAMKRDLTIYF